MLALYTIVFVFLNKITVKIIGQANLTALTTLIYKIQVGIELFHPKINLSQPPSQQQK